MQALLQWRFELSSNSSWKELGSQQEVDWLEIYLKQYANVISCKFGESSKQVLQNTGSLQNYKYNKDLHIGIQLKSYLLNAITTRIWVAFPVTQMNRRSIDSESWRSCLGELLSSQWLGTTWMKSGVVFIK